MGSDDKVHNAAGKVANNERLEAEGRADQASVDIEKAAEKVKDALK